MKEKQLILVGGGGHCKAVIDVAMAAGRPIMGIIDESLAIGDSVAGPQEGCLSPCLEPENDCRPAGHSTGKKFRGVQGQALRTTFPPYIIPADPRQKEQNEDIPLSFLHDANYLLS